MKTATFVRSPTAKMRIIASGLEFPEGPIAMDDGSVLVSEISGCRLTRVLPDGKIEQVAEIAGGPNSSVVPTTARRS